MNMTNLNLPQVSEFERGDARDAEQEALAKGYGHIGGHDSGHAPGSALVVKNYNPISGVEVKELILKRFRAELDLHPELTEVKSYPKARLEAIMRFDIHQYPFEENRHKLGEIHFQITLDAIPPDALRILEDMPVPTPTAKAGSGLDGGATVVDEMRKADPDTVAAVKEQFDRQPSSGAGGGGAKPGSAKPPSNSTPGTGGNRPR